MTSSELWKTRWRSSENTSRSEPALRGANITIREVKKQAARAAVRPRSYRVAPNVGFVDSREMRRSPGTGSRQSAPRRRTKYKGLRTQTACSSTFRQSAALPEVLQHLRGGLYALCRGPHPSKRSLIVSGVRRPSRNRFPRLIPPPSALNLILSASFHKTIFFRTLLCPHSPGAVCPPS